jgi:hypothetical protein
MTSIGEALERVAKVLEGSGASQTNAWPNTR